MAAASDSPEPSRNDKKLECENPPVTEREVYTFVDDTDVYGQDDAKVPEPCEHVDQAPSIELELRGRAIPIPTPILNLPKVQKRQNASEPLEPNDLEASSTRTEVLDKVESDSSHQTHLLDISAQDSTTVAVGSVQNEDAKPELEGNITDESPLVDPLVDDASDTPSDQTDPDSEIDTRDHQLRTTNVTAIQHGVDVVEPPVHNTSDTPPDQIDPDLKLGTRDHQPLTTNVTAEVNDALLGLIGVITNYHEITMAELSRSAKVPPRSFIAIPSIEEPSTDNDWDANFPPMASTNAIKKDYDLAALNDLYENDPRHTEKPSTPIPKSKPTTPGGPNNVPVKSCIFCGDPRHKIKNCFKYSKWRMKQPTAKFN